MRDAAEPFNGQSQFGCGDIGTHAAKHQREEASSAEHETMVLKCSCVRHIGSNPSVLFFSGRSDAARMEAKFCRQSAKKIVAISGKYLYRKLRFFTLLCAKAN